MFSIPSLRPVGVLVTTLALCLTTACTEDAPTSASAGPTLPEPALSSASTMSTATITFETRVAGYSNSGNAGWIKVTDTCGGGGRVVRGGTTSACTDRVARGEPIRVTISSGQSNRSQMVAFTGVTSSNGFGAGSIVTLPQTATFVVSHDPSFDNVYVAVVLLSPSWTPFGGLQQRRVPIGRRP
jgi:hypothetical protein